MRIAIFTFLSVCALAQESTQTPALKAAHKWLPLIDTAKYSESWKQASGLFKKALTEDQWTEACVQARAPLGQFTSRSFALSQVLKDPPNAPPGDYYLFQFNADFQNRNGATETVILVRQSENNWRVTGYFIK